MALPWKAMSKSIINLKTKHTRTVFKLLLEHNCRTYFQTSCLHAKNTVKPTKTPYLKSSKPLRDAKKSDSNVNNKPKHFAVVGGFTVDEDIFNKIRAEETKVDDEDFDEADLKDVLQNSEYYYDMYTMEEKALKRRNSYKNLERKLLPSPRERPLMMWAAREQVCYLHRTDPDEWTPDKIAEHFPISVTGAAKLLRSKFTFATAAEIKAYNERVQENWKAIGKGHIEFLNESLQERRLNGLLHPSQALPNAAFPNPSPANPNPPLLLLDDPNKPLGEFYALVKPYIEIKKRHERSKQEESSGLVMSYPDDSERSDWLRVTTSPALTDDQNEIDDETYRLSMKSKEHVTRDQFELNMKEHLQKKTEKTEDDVKMLAWLQNRNYLEVKKGDDNDKKLVTESDVLKNIPVKKYKIGAKIMFDGSRNDPHAEAYMYSQELGYQHPLGKLDHVDTHLKSKKAIKVGDGSYRVEDSFYTEDGEFLYKTLNSDKT